MSTAKSSLGALLLLRVRGVRYLGAAALILLGSGMATLKNPLVDYTPTTSTLFDSENRTNSLPNTIRSVVYTPFIANKNHVCLALANVL